MKAGIVLKIFCDHFETYQREHPVSERERRAAWNMMTCRTAEQGYHVDACPKGHYQVILSNSYKHRSCPQCGMMETELWLERRRLQSLACRYYHLVFTISHWDVWGHVLYFDILRLPLFINFLPENKKISRIKALRASRRSNY
jgi:hypothetical protein